MLGFYLSHYHIVSELGRGGMGVVYRAQDTNLDRTVALKVLPAHALASEEDRARFYREARAAARLNHPNIATIHQIDEAVLVAPGGRAGEAAPDGRAGEAAPDGRAGEAAPDGRAGEAAPDGRAAEAVPDGRAAPVAPDGRSASVSPDAEKRPFIAMEFVDGESLADRVARGPLKLEEAVRLAGEIASALGAAHAAGVVHRDIKSGNVMLTAKGEAKVLDFGLAKTAASTQLTRQGSTLGTVAYMSPEQARGEDVDGRTDLWALGVVLYEMIAGRLPFKADYEQAALYGILNEDPEPLTSLRTGVPMELEAIVEKLLRKEARLRYQTAADLTADLEAVRPVVSSPGASGSSRVSGPRKTAVRADARISGGPDRRWLVPLASGLVCLLAGFLIARMTTSTGTDTLPLDVELSLPGLDAMIAETSFGSAAMVAISPDGRYIAYTGVEPEDGLFVRDLTSDEPARRIAQASDSPAFSPDSRSVAYSSEGSLYRAGVQGDAPTVVTRNLPDVVGMTWSADGHIYYARDYGSGIRRVPEQGGEEVLLTTPDTTRGEIGHVHPTMLPDGKTLLFQVYGTNGYEISLIDLDSGIRRTIGNGIAPHFVAPDIVLFAQGPRLLAARLDLQNATLGPTVVVTEKLYLNIPSLNRNFDLSANGDLIVVDGFYSWGSGFERRLWDGSIQTFRPEVPDISNFSLSADGRYIALAAPQPVNDPDLWLFDTQTLDTRRLTTHPLYDEQPTWAPDGSLIVFSSERLGQSDIYTIDPRTREEKLVVHDANQKYVSSVSPDGRYVAYQMPAPGRANDVGVADLTGQNPPVVIVQTEANEVDAQFSPVANLIAYTSNESGPNDVFVISFPVTGPRRRVTIGGGENPEWSRDGRSLYYRRGSTLYRIPVNPDGSRGGEPTRVMENLKDQFELLPDETGIFARTPPPRRAARLVQQMTARIAAELDGPR